MSEVKLTSGEWLVGKSFNPGGLDSVNQIKKLAAELIDLSEKVCNDNRTLTLAVQAFEEGAMWAVKSATKNLN